MYTACITFNSLCNLLMVYRGSCLSQLQATLTNVLDVVGQGADNQYCRDFMESVCVYQWHL